EVMVQARPAMLTIMATKNTTVGRQRRKPSEAARAMAQTASNMPEMIRTNHAMTDPSESVLSVAGTAPSSAGPGPGLRDHDNRRHDGDRWRRHTSQAVVPPGSRCRLRAISR